MVLVTVTLVTFSVDSSYQMVSFGPETLTTDLSNPTNSPTEGSQERPQLPQISERRESGLPSSFSYSEATAILSYYAAQVDGVVSSDEVQTIKDYMGRNWNSGADINVVFEEIQESFQNGEMERRLTQALEDISNLPYDQQTQILTETWHFMQDIGMELGEITRITYRWLEENLSINIYDIIESVNKQ
jgi:hypothetical protein